MLCEGMIIVCPFLSIIQATGNKCLQVLFCERGTERELMYLFTQQGQQDPSGLSRVHLNLERTGEVVHRAL